jgi:predicted nuclease of restriction endonuclease-like (RecB) superfamily
MSNSSNNLPTIENSLFDELSKLIEQSQRQLAIQANSTVTLLYGKLIVPTISKQLENKYGRNFEIKNLRRMIQFAEQFNDFQIVVPLARQLSWSHFLILLPIKNFEAKLFYAQKSLDETLGRRELRRQIALKTFERTNIADAQITESTQIPLKTFKDPYILDLLGLQNTFLEKDLENAILHDLEIFILELGKGFSFVERQKRMIIDGEDFYLDLLFYHRKLKRLVAIELKLGKFQAKHKGQMELYLKWLDRYEKQEGENTPIGLILCAESSREQIELLEMNKDGIMVAEYWTDLPPKKEFEEKIHLILTEVKERIERKKIL